VQRIQAQFDGIDLTENYVYKVRAQVKVAAARNAKRAAAKMTSSPTTSVNGAQPSVTLPATTSSAEDLLRAIAAELGLGRAVEILEGARASVRAMLGR
jgi:hypothetical protein